MKKPDDSPSSLSIFWWEESVWDNYDCHDLQRKDYNGKKVAEVGTMSELLASVALEGRISRF